MKTGPLVSLREGQLSQTYRIVVDIARQGKEIIGFVHNQTFKASLEQMSMSVIATVIINRICSEKSSHELGDGSVSPAFQKEVKMVAHQAKNMNTKIKKDDILLEIMKKLEMVLGIVKCDIAGICSGHSMIERERDIYPSWPRHEEILFSSRTPVSRFISTFPID